MTDKEISGRVRVFAAERNIGEEYVYVIPKKELEPDTEYEGICRNAGAAVWDGEEFVYKRYKFGSWFDEKINHFEDDEGYDVFVPMKVIENEH